MRLLKVAALLGASTTIFGGCTEPNPGYWGGPRLPEECRAGEEVVEVFDDFERPEEVDLLLLVANSGEVSAYQEALSKALPAFLEGLEEAELSVQIGVMTTDANAKPGLAEAVEVGEECKNNHAQVVNVGDKDWTRSAACNVLQGTNGAARQQPLALLHQVLAEDNSLLEGFRRERARLVALVLTNQDDCSGGDWHEKPQGSIRDQCTWRADDLGDVDEYVEAIRGTAHTPEGFSFVVISGPEVGVQYEEGTAVRAVCSSTLGSAYPSPRLTRAAQIAGEEGLFLSSCVLDLHGHLKQIKERLLARDFVTICPSEPMAHEPLELQGEFEDGQVRPLSFGADFVFQGPHKSCQNGAIRLQRQEDSSLKTLELRYCAKP